jgi:type IV pilus assembly protein PilM
MAKKVKTIFISDYTIDLLVVDGKKVKKWASLPLEAGLVSQGVVIDEVQVADKIKELFKVLKEGGGKFIACLSGINSIYRIISLPELPESIVPEAVKQEASRVIPIPLDEVYLSYQRIPAPPGETRVFLAAFPRNVADTCYRTLQQANIEPYLMDLAPLALCRTLDEPRAIIVNAKLDNIDVVLMVDRLPQLIRTLSLPGEAASLSERLPAIVEEIDRTITFYNSSHKEDTLDSSVPMFVCGDLEQTPENWQSLSTNLNCPVSILPSPLEVPENFNSGDFMVNIGLALKELLDEKEKTNVSLINLNVMPKSYLPKAIPVSKFLVPIGIIIGVGILGYMGFTIRNNMASTEALGSEIVAVQNTIDQQEKEIGDMKGQVTQLEAQIMPIEARTNVFETTLTSLGDGRTLVDRHMDDIVRLLPTDADFVEINHETEDITISGLVKEEIDAEDDIIAYARSLKGFFSSVIISSIEAVEDEEGEFIGYKFEFLVN